MEDPGKHAHKRCHNRRKYRGGAWDADLSSQDKEAKVFCRCAGYYRFADPSRRVLLLSFWKTMRVAIVSIIIIGALFFLCIWLMSRYGLMHVETPEKKAGRLGENFATGIIREILQADDVLLTNIPVSFGDQQSELDNVIINSCGIFIIEVKNLAGTLIGSEDESKWIQTGSSGMGSFSQKIIKNPISQVKRQVGIIESIMKEHGIEVPVKGYVFFVERNCPVKSRFVLETQMDIDSAIHRNGSVISEEERAKEILQNKAKAKAKPQDIVSVLKQATK